MKSHTFFREQGRVEESGGLGRERREVIGNLKGLGFTSGFIAFEMALPSAVAPVS